MDGVLITQGATGTQIGGTAAAQGNVISANTLAGIVIGQSATDATVQNNLIGTIWSGFENLGNGQDGVELQGSKNSLVSNVISGNFSNGVVINGSSNLLQGNIIGLDSSGESLMANEGDGIVFNVTSGVGDNLVGGVSAAARNCISGNLDNGIEITGPASANNRIDGNFIGTDESGTQAIDNFQNGILIDDTTGYTIGGSAEHSGNLISGNNLNGIEITGPDSTNLQVLGNKIGTDVTGQSEVGNSQNGIAIADGASNNTIGGTGANEGNLISGNLANGVWIGGVSDSDVGSLQTAGNQLLGNKIGTNLLAQRR